MNLDKARRVDVASRGPDRRSDPSGRPSPAMHPRLIEGLSKATALARKWCSGPEMPQEIRPLVDSSFPSGASLVFLSLHWLRTQARASNLTLHLAALAETNFIISLAQAHLLAGAGSCDRSALLATFERTVRSVHEVGRKAGEGNWQVFVDCMDQMQTQRAICEAELALFEWDPQRQRVGDADPLEDLVRHTFVAVVRLADQRDGAWTEGACLFAERMAKSTTALARGRQCWLAGATAAAEEYLRYSEVWLASCFSAPPFGGTASSLLPLFERHRQEVREGAWDSVFAHRLAPALAPLKPVHLPHSRPSEDRAHASLSGWLMSHLELEGSTAARDIAAVYRDPLGKLLRGKLTICFAQMLGANEQGALRAAVGVEEIHRASLLIDDFLDESLIRHGRPSLWARHGAHRAFSVVRLLLARAMGLLLRDQPPRVFKMFHQTVRRMVEGLRSEASSNELPSWSHYLSTIDRKTASLFSFACEVGALVGGDESRQCKRAAAIGRNFGMAFQLIDDNLDYFGTSVLGKKTGTDFAAGIVTGPVLLLAARAPECRKLVTEVFSAPTRTHDAFSHMRALMLEHEIPERIRKRAKDYVRAGIADLTTLPAGEGRAGVERIFSQVVERAK